ncbi:MAG: COR domain-containing protein [Pseudonocardiaceae bacterium]
MTTLPPEIGQLTNLCELRLDGNQLVALPPEIGQLVSLQNLHLEGNQLVALPPEIGQLARLQNLHLEGNRLGALPPEIGRLTNLDFLSLESNRLSALPMELGQLVNLEVLRLEGNRLTALPPEIGQLTRLQSLHLESNDLGALPSEIGQLIRLRSLHLADNQLSALPVEIGRLAHLEFLNLEGNQLGVLPRELGRLIKLEVLRLEGNRLTALPPEIGRLINLEFIDLGGNHLTTLSPELGDLPEVVLLRLGGNSLREPLLELLERGANELFAYLRSLKDAEPQYEAKLLLVGEGKVGKTSLVAALQGKPFIENRPPTHPIEVGKLRCKHPGLIADITMNTWDFGGQEVYRITQQFFFSRRALYLVVWHPRQGVEQNEVEGWLRRIRLRVGEDARVIVVATHADEMGSPELDYPSLKQKFGDLLAGHYTIDSCSGTGIDELHQAIADQAAKLPQMGERWSRRWIAAHDEIRALSQPQITRQEFVTSCARHRLDGEATATLANLLHDLGHIIYYGEDDGLRDIIVLQHEWLTKAISYVLNDQPTRAAGGVLDHARLKDIWGRDDAYPTEYHPYFLRLMEKFDVSHRLPEEERKSLVGQLVPYEKPVLPWSGAADVPDTRTLGLVCSMDELPSGLVAWLTVRNHHHSTGLHWRSGVFLEYRRYDSEALFELFGDRHLMLTVCAPSPDYFFNILRGSLEELVSERWPGLRYELFVPCPKRLDSRIQCTGRFKFQTLDRRRQRGDVQIDCRECDELYDVAQLLTGFAAPALPRLDEVLNRLDDVAVDLHRLRACQAELANGVRNILKVVTTEVDDCPRLFTFVPVESGWRRAQIWQRHYRLTLWCEHPDHWHAWPEATYDANCQEEWFRDAAPYLRLVIKTLRLILPVAKAVAGVVWNEQELGNTKNKIDLMGTIVEKLPPPDIRDDTAIEPQSHLTSAQGAGLRALRQLLFELDRSRSFGGLRRFHTQSGDVLWICPKHSREYDPGLPHSSEL